MDYNDPNRGRAQNVRNRTGGPSDPTTLRTSFSPTLPVRGHSNPQNLDPSSDRYAWSSMQPGSISSQTMSPQPGYLQDQARAQEYGQPADPNLYSMLSQTSQPAQYAPYPQAPLMYQEAYSSAGATSSYGQQPYRMGLEQGSASQAQSQTPQVQSPYEIYQTRLGLTFQNIYDKNLACAVGHLLGASEALLRNVYELNLVFDNETTYPDRLHLFREFNKAWLSLAQMQLNMTEEATEAGRSIPSGLLSETELRQLGDRLVQLCDSVQKQGLVDYEMGVEEERIVDLLLKCIDSLKTLEDNDEQATAGEDDPGSSSNE